MHFSWKKLTALGHAREAVQSLYSTVRTNCLKETEQVSYDYTTILAHLGNRWLAGNAGSIPDEGMDDCLVNVVL